MHLRIALSLSLLTIVLTTPAFADGDAEGSKDVFVTRMAGFTIKDCDVKEFDTYTFAEGYPGATKVEGRIVKNEYTNADEGHPIGALQVRRNYENALKQAGWKVVYADENLLTERLEKDGTVHWFELGGNGGDYYTLTLGEPAAMEQTVTSADSMHAALERVGHIALQVNFDTGKADIRKDSAPLIDQIVILMKGSPTLHLGVEGHTDNVGKPAANKALSLARANAVVAALVAKGIAAERLVPAGYGQERPIADNSTEAGRAQNRRVELVKK